MEAKVPEITLLFWVLKIIATGMGEATSDWLGSVSVALSASVGVIGLIVALVLQFRARRYIAPIYWLVVVMVAIVGTGAADSLHGLLYVPYIGSTALYAVVLSVVLYLWHRSEGTLDIHSIVTRRREVFYWLTVFATFALGTATGDLTASSFGLGYLPSGIMFSVFILIPAVAWWRFRLNEVFAFWFAYIITRPLGASFADWFGKPPPGALALGDGAVSGVATIVLIVLVAYVTITKSDIQERPIPVPLPTAEPASMPRRR
jgi:uncharacterized membrane-anchored protein